MKGVWAIMKDMPYIIEVLKGEGKLWWKQDMKRCWSRNAPKLIKTIKTQNSGELQTKVDQKKKKKRN